MKNSLNIVLSGEAGQGLKTIEDFLVKAIAKDYGVFSTKEVMSRVRGGNNSVLIRVSDEDVNAYSKRIDLLFLLNSEALERMKARVDEDTSIFGEEKFIDKDFVSEKNIKTIIVDIREIAKEAGSIKMENTVIFGMVAGILSLDEKFCVKIIKDKFNKKSEEIFNQNKEAFEKGFEIGEKKKDLCTISKIPERKEKVIKNGSEAIGIGALGGGCNFIASYPMSPATGVLIYLASKGKEFDVLVEQAEDEIAALNMVIGAWYTGARGLATTSGGGAALMSEAVSLSGITETPFVLHIAQRPGPATGLPTRTEQGDLNLALYSGHGEFERIIYAPGSIEETIRLSQKSFYMADRYQVPVFILTDQYLLDSYNEYEKFELDSRYLESFVVKSQKDYKRYNLSFGNISPRSIPGFGEGLVKVDSDEHDEEGYITEDFDVRIKMNDKRLGKKKLLKAETEKYNFLGNKESEYIIVGWGSTKGVLEEFIQNSKDLGYVHVSQVYPLSDRLKKLLSDKKVIVVENNATGQFANLLKLELDINAYKRILKYNGEPFSIEEIEYEVKEALK